MNRITNVMNQVISDKQNDKKKKSQND